MLLNIRNYRINLQDSFNNKGNGISLFDLLGTFFIAYIIEQYINLDSKKKTIILFIINSNWYYRTLFNWTRNIFKYTII
jgi:hypothetical protein